MVGHMVSGRNVSVLGLSFAIVFLTSVSSFNCLDRSSPKSLVVGAISGLHNFVKGDSRSGLISSRLFMFKLQFAWLINTRLSMTCCKTSFAQLVALVCASLANLSARSAREESP